MKILSFLWVPSIFVLFWLFFKIGLIFFGGGYVLIPVLHKELVINLHLLSERQFIDGTAISQLTPGPVGNIRRVLYLWCLGGNCCDDCNLFTRHLFDDVSFEKLCVNQEFKLCL